MNHPGSLDDFKVGTEFHQLAKFLHSTANTVNCTNCDHLLLLAAISMRHLNQLRWLTKLAHPTILDDSSRFSDEKSRLDEKTYFSNKLF